MVATNAETMTSAEAAIILGISVRQVQRFVESGQIANRGVIGRSALLDSESVHRLATVGTARGRTWNASTVWQAMALLDDRQGLSNGLSESKQAQLSHLRNRVRHMDAESLVRMSRKRAKITRWRVSDSYDPEVHKQVVVTAASALDSRDGGEQLARSLGLATRSWDGQVDGYVTVEQLSRLEREFFMVADGGGKVTLRVTEDVETLADLRYPFRACLPVVALDLAESTDIRERSAGLRALSTLMRRV